MLNFLYNCSVGNVLGNPYMFFIALLCRIISGFITFFLVGNQAAVKYCNWLCISEKKRDLSKRFGINLLSFRNIPIGPLILFLR